MRQAFELARLGRSEKDLLDEVIEFVCIQNSAETISEFSHNRVWDMADFGDELPYNSVYQIFPAEVSLEALAWGEAESGAIEAERSRSNAMDYVTLADFRSRVLETRRSR